MSEDHEKILDGPASGKIGKQIQLPLSKAIEISIKSLKTRFWRSMLTVSLIILAIAFLTFVWTANHVQSAVAIGMKPDAARITAVSQEIDVYWKPFEFELSHRFGRQKRDYAKMLKKLYAGNTGAFKQLCIEGETASLAKKKVNFTDIKTEITHEKIEELAELVRTRLKLEPDLEGWPTDPLTASKATSRYKLKLAGIKGVVQGEVQRYNNLQLALQRRDVKPDTPDEELRAMSPTVVWLIIISLLVCGVGITNAMLMSVTERFREIGTMKCLGALDGFIVKLFLLESTFQGVAGTILGILIGLIIMLLSGLAAFGMATFHYFPVIGVLLIVLYALVIGSALSVIGAVLPALRAAHMAPVEAMRVEE